MVMTPDDALARSSAEVMQALVHQLTMVLTEISQATHLALVRLAEAQEIMGMATGPEPRSVN